jgi:hypothetical protein
MKQIPSNILESKIPVTKSQIQPQSSAPDDKPLLSAPTSLNQQRRFEQHQLAKQKQILYQRQQQQQQQQKQQQQQQRQSKQPQQVYQSNIRTIPQPTAPILIHPLNNSNYNSGTNDTRLSTSTSVLPSNVIPGPTNCTLQPVPIHSLNNSNYNNKRSNSNISNSTINNSLSHRASENTATAHIPITQKSSSWNDESDFLLSDADMARIEEIERLSMQRRLSTSNNAISTSKNVKNTSTNGTNTSTNDVSNSENSHLVSNINTATSTDEIPPPIIASSGTNDTRLSTSTSVLSLNIIPGPINCTLQPVPITTVTDTDTHRHEKKSEKVLIENEANKENNAYQLRLNVQHVRDTVTCERDDNHSQLPISLKRGRSTMDIPTQEYTLTASEDIDDDLHLNNGNESQSCKRQKSSVLKQIYDSQGTYKYVCMYTCIYIYICTYLYIYTYLHI